MSKIEIYTRDLCVFCDRAKYFFKSKNLSYIEYNVYEDPIQLEIMLKKSNGQKTMPQIFINDCHIGGFHHLKKIIDSGKFEKIIKS